MCRRNTAGAVELANPLGKLVFLGSPRSYTQLRAGEESWSL
jgi:hypothetical protein